MIDRSRVESWRNRFKAKSSHDHVEASYQFAFLLRLKTRFFRSRQQAESSWNRFFSLYANVIIRLHCWRHRWSSQHFLQKWHYWTHKLVWVSHAMRGTFQTAERFQCLTNRGTPPFHFQMAVQCCAICISSNDTLSWCRDPTSTNADSH